METLKDFDFTLQYHPGKANVVADALSRRSVSVSSLIMARQQELWEAFRDLHLNVEFAPGILKFGMIKISSGLLEDIANSQDDVLIQEKRNLIVQGKTAEFKIRADNVLRCNGRICVPEIENMRKKFFCSEMFIHSIPPDVNMY